MKRILFITPLALALWASAAEATQTENFGIHAVPAPGKVVIDGKLDDWDTSGQVLMCYDLQSLRDVYSAQVATMYDSENYYISLHWKDPIPMGNSHDPRYQGNRGWAGDCVQLRLKTDRISHITAWYYAAKQAPTIQIDYGKSLTEPFKGGSIQLYQTAGWKMDKGAEMGFMKDADGRGYVQEIKLPWSLITTGEKPFGGGQKIAMGVELLWGEADWPVHRYADNLAEGASSREFFWSAYNNWGPVWLENKGKLKLPEPAYMVAYRNAQEGGAMQGPVEISYELPKESLVTLAIETPDGVRVRNLISGLRRDKGKNTEKWDGLSDTGKPMPPGDYVFKALYHGGIHSKYAMSFANPGDPTWDTSDGRGAFYGDHTAAHAAAASGDFVALACPMGEAGRHMIGLNTDGQRLWGLANRVAFDGGKISLATDGKILWVASEGKNAIIYRVEMATGKYKPWNKTDKDAAGNEFKVLDLPVSTLPGIKSDSSLGPNLSSIALRDGTLAVAFTRENKVRLLDSDTGAVKSEVDVTAPKSLAYAPDGSLLVLSEGKIFRVNAAGNKSQVGTINFTDGYGVAVDPAGNIYLSVRGSEQNVKVFSAAGQPLREIGQRGGRPANGAYIANAMRNPGQLAIDSKGRLWVPEETMNPKRTSVWDTASGKLHKDLSGTTTYAGAGAINPYDPTMAFSDDTVYKLDWEKGSYAPVYSLDGGGSADAIFAPETHGITSRVVKRGALTYAFSNGSARGSRELQCTVWNGKEWKSAAHIGTVLIGDKQGPLKKYQGPLFEGHANEMYAWADKNGDGLTQADEMTFAKLEIDGKPDDLRSFYWGQLPDADGTVVYMATKANALVKFPIMATTPSGAPIYDVTKPVIIKMDRDVRGGNGEGMLIGGTDGRVYLNQDPLITVDKNGKVIGGYPNPNTSVHGSHNASASKPGYLIGPSSFLGTADFGGQLGEVFDLNGNLGENYLFTSDGLWIQSLFKDTRGYFEFPQQAVRGMPMDAITAGGESFGGNFVRTGEGKVYLTLGGTDARVLELNGFDSIRRFNGRFSYSAAQYAAAQDLVRANAALKNQPMEYLVKRQAAPVMVDGKTTDWPELMDDGKPGLEIQENPQQRYARVLAKYDDTNLYLAYRVFAPRGAMKNVGQDDRLLFKNGDAVDLMIGPDKGAKGFNNSRLLLSMPRNTPVAVLNQKVAPGAPASEKFAFSSPWRTIIFDRVVTLNNVPMASNPIQGGYFVEATVPWSVLGITPKSGLKLRADVGALFADTGGTITVSRQYWSNKATNLVNDVPGEADLTPELWGTFTLE